MVNCINLIIEMSPRFLLGRENVPCVAEVVNRSLKADCTDFTAEFVPNALKQLFFVLIVFITAEIMSCIHIKQ